MTLRTGTLITEIDAHLALANLTEPEQFKFVNEVKDAITNVIGEEKLFNEDEIVTDEEKGKIKERVSGLEKPVGSAINEFLFYFELILRIESDNVEEEEFA